MAAIRKLHWGRVGARVQRATHGVLFALWPEPLDHDLCFEQAGFTLFDDSDDDWDTGFDSLLQEVIATLQSVAGSLRYSGSPQMSKGGFFGITKEVQPEQHLGFATRDDQWPPCRLEFGDDARASLLTSDGHPILWVWLSDALCPSWQTYLQTVAAGRPTIETPLDWAQLLPEMLKH